MKTYITQRITRTGMIYAGPRIQAEGWADADTEAEMLNVCLVGELKSETGGEDE